MKKVVATGGGFDPLHIGHIRLFNAAKRLGDTLVVILNSDDFLIRKKGYVFMTYHERWEVIVNLKSVDFVIECIDKDQTVAKTLEMLKPDIFAKGGDKNIDNIPESEREVCKRLGIKIVSLVGGRKVQSSSQLIENIIKHYEKRTHKN